MKSKLLLIAYRAFGDWVFTTPILPFLFEKYDVYLDCNLKVYSLVYDDPRFKEIIVFNDSEFLTRINSDPEFDKDKFIQSRLQELYDRIQPDKIIDLSMSLENRCIASREQEIFRASLKERQNVFSKYDYYEEIFKHSGLEVPKYFKLDTMYFSPKQIQVVESWRKKHTSDFLVMVPLLGSCMQKFYPDIYDVILHIINKYHNSHVYLIGEHGIYEGGIDHDRVHDLTGKISIKQTFLMTKYADYVLGPETGVVVAAGMFGTHKTMLCNTVKVSQVCGKHKNDHSLQSNWFCSPCHKGIYIEEDCDAIKYLEGVPYSGCVHGFKKEDILTIVDEVYNKTNIYNKDYIERYIERANTSLGRTIYKARWDLIEKYCHGNLKLLDYGCASGAFHKSSRNGFVTSGYDVNPLSQYHKLPEGKVDILTMWDVIEHLHDPSEPIRKFNPEYLFITTPNLHRGVDFPTWKHNRPQEHLHYFDEDSLGRLVEQEGYEVLEFNYIEGAIRDPEKDLDIVTVVARKR